MDARKKYYLTTSLYVLAGLVFFVFFLIGSFQKNWILMLVSFIAVYVAFDNVGCSDRRCYYLGKGN